MEPPIALLAFSVIILGLGVVMLTVFGGNTESRIAKLENIHKWGNWHDE